MKIITAADFNFKEIVNASYEQTLKAGYDTHIYSISDSLGFGQPFDLNEYNLDLIKNLNIHQDFNLKLFYKKNSQSGEIDIIPIGRLAYKPYIIRDALKSNQFVVWLDADAFIIKNIDHIQDNTFDIGITVRPPEEQDVAIYKILNGYINAGVLFINNTDNARQFINEWIREIPFAKFLSDQEALNRLIFKYLPNFKFDKFNQIIHLNNIRIKIFSTLEYNWYYYPKLPLFNSKIIHIKNNLRDTNKLHEWFTKNWQLT